MDEEELPACFTANMSLLLPSEPLRAALLDSDLSVQQLDRIVGHLWLAGKPYLPRPLSSQQVLGRALIPTNDPSLHLVWTSHKIFVRAVPRYVLSESFFNGYLMNPRLQDADPSHSLPHGPALGLLHSYTALIPTELDFALAKSANLVPKDYPWDEWRGLVKRLLQEYPNTAIYRYLPPRYLYGELRLSRLDKISRLWKHKWLQGYSALTGPQRYVEYLAENLTVILAATGYIVVILSAMQVALAANGDQTLKDLCYRFSIFSMVFPMIAVCFVLAIFIVMFVVYWHRTLVVQEKRFRDMGLDPRKY